MKFKSAKELQDKIEEYFAECDARTTTYVTKEGDVIQVPDQRPYTITGLALHLGCDRDTLLNYEDREEFFGTIRKAKLKCENYAEESLWRPKIASGVIFNLTNNYGWKNKQDVEHTGLEGIVEQILGARKRARIDS